MSKAGYLLRDDIAVLSMDNPPVNSLDLQLRRALVAGLERANADSAVAAVVLIGSKAGFSGGAEIREFGTPRAMAQPNLLSVITSIEESHKPVIAAVGALAMGGGLELALGCHYRVGAAAAKIALPEVKLGLLPGAGGTQRLPRLLGADAALNMIVSGATVASEKLRASPLFDAFTDGDLLAEALAFARRVLQEKLPAKRVRDAKLSMPNHEAFFQFARNTVKSLAGHYPAPLACVEAVAGAYDRPFEEGMKRERELFSALMQSPESAALRHIFQSERAASHIVDVPGDTPVRAIRKVGIIGAGTMGGGIAMTMINAGIPVVLLEMKQEALDRGLETMRRNYGGALKKGTLTEAALQQRLALVTPTLEFSALRDVDLVIEAVFEDIGVKQQVFEQLDQVIRAGAILASNTSALNLDEIAAFTRRPQDVIGLHFFSPANVMRLLEIVRGAKTGKDVLASAMQLAKKIGKIAVVAGVCDGFIGNRMVARYGAAAHDLIMMGALPQQVDNALQEFGMAMGPFRMGDLAGLDIGWASRKRRAAQFPERDFANVADALCEAGRFGQKSGAGFYRYQAGSGAAARAAIPDPAVAAIIEQFRKRQGITPRKVSNEEIVERCIYALINEGARIIEDGIAQRSSDIDIVYVNGYGFPAWRGGPMFYAGQVGLSEVARALRRIADAAPDADKAFWMPAALLTRLADDGKHFSEYKGPSK
jgi:3-hydroxyacyl-CoA dehydrogenase